MTLARVKNFSYGKKLKRVFFRTFFPVAVSCSEESLGCGNKVYAYQECGNI